MKTITIISIFIVIIIILSGFIFIDLSTNEEDIIIDTDGDNVVDKIDAFPYDPAASLDSDNDGYPDNWNPGKSQSDSTSEPQLIRDECPYDPEEFKDSDGDFVGDIKDAFPYNPEEWSDIDSDGYGDNVDINPYVNLSFKINIDKFRVKKRVDLFRWAQIYFDIKINGVRYLRIDNNGTYFQVILNQLKDVNHEQISYDISDETKNKFTDIEIIMYDYDLIGFDDIVDINNELGKKTLKLRFDHVKNEISATGYTEGRQAILWFDINFEKEISLNQTFYNKNFSWNFNNKLFNLPFKIDVNTYKNYQTLNTSRQPQSQPYPDDKMASFVTSKERVILDLTDELELIKASESYDSIDKINYYLRFVQDTINYRFDNETSGCEEYWKYPVETLVDQHGDCEDTSVLLASILDSLDYDVALLYYSWKENDERLGHLAVGVSLDGDYGSYILGEDGKKYFYCETTSENFLVGEIPERIKGEPKRIIPI